MAKITLDVSDALNRKIEEHAENKFQTPEQFILECVSARLQGGAGAIRSGAGADEIMTFTEFADWLGNNMHDEECRRLYVIFDTFVKGNGEIGMPTKQMAKR